uniref:Uncharacterized protein LOC113789312 n=1 Tax=Dermatophagoides pteronyssinus TaxID=6956 RepID=A0A6P6XP59_DERPT
KNFEKLFYEHIFSLFYYNRLILEKWPNLFTINYNGNNNNKEKIFNQKIQRPFLHVILPGLITTLFAITLLIYVCQPVWCENYNFWLLHNFVPENCKIYSLIVGMTWSWIHFLQMFFGYRQRLKYFRFLIILNLNQLNGLNEHDRYKLRLFMEIIFIGLKIVSHIISIGAYLAMTVQVFNKSLWNISILWLLFWMIIYIFWPYYICSALYMFPAFILPIHYYIELKQKSINRKIFQLKYSTQTKQRFGRIPQKIIRDFLQLNQKKMQNSDEIVDIDIQSRRLLTILFVGFSILITYITYLIFFAKLTFVYRLLFIVVYLGHSFTLLSMIYSSSKIVTKNEQFHRLNRKCLDNFY